MHSNAYNGDDSEDIAHNPWDDYYFTDFKTRVHKYKVFNDKTIIADVPTNCRYSNGPYAFIVKTTTSNNGVNDSTVQNVIFDIFKPYITDVNIIYSNEVLYQVVRADNEGTKNPGDMFFFRKLQS